MSKEDIKKHQWTKGQSGNPSGKKKGTKNRSTIIRNARYDGAGKR